MTPMECKEYMQFPVNVVLDEIMDEYNLHEIRHKDHVYAEIVCGMYGLPQVGRLANKLLAQQLAKHEAYGNTQCAQSNSHSLWMTFVLSI